MMTAVNKSWSLISCEWPSKIKKHMFVLTGVVVTSVKQNSVCIEFCTSYLGQLYESYAIELTSDDATPVSVIRHNLPYFVPLQQIATDCSTVAKEIACGQFVWAVYRYLHAFVVRRQETVLAQVCFACLSVTCSICHMQEPFMKTSGEVLSIVIVYELWLFMYK